MNEYDQNAIDAAAMEENQFLINAQMQHLQQRVVTLNLEKRALLQEIEALRPPVEDESVDEAA